jgi:hypothetical protein
MSIGWKKFVYCIQYLKLKCEATGCLYFHFPYVSNAKKKNYSFEDAFPLCLYKCTVIIIKR